MREQEYNLHPPAGIRLASEGKFILLGWVVSHVGLGGNNKTDREDNQSGSLPTITFDVGPDLWELKRYKPGASQGHSRVLSGSRNLAESQLAQYRQPNSAA